MSGRKGFSRIESRDEDEANVDAPYVYASTAVELLPTIDELSTMSHYESVMMRISENSWTNRDMLNQFLGVRQTRTRSSLTRQKEEKRTHQSRLESAYKYDAEESDMYIQEFDEWSQDARVPSVVHLMEEEEKVPGSCKLGPASLLIDAQGDSVPQDCLGFRPSRRHVSVRGGSGETKHGKSVSTPQTLAMDESNPNHGGVLASLGCLLGSPRNGKEKGMFAKNAVGDSSDDDSSMENKLYWDQRFEETRGLLDRF